MGSKDDLKRVDMIVKDLSWICEDTSDRANVTVKIRSAHDGVLANLNRVEDGCVKVSFRNPVEGIAPGQAAVFYDGDEVLGGGWIFQ